MTRCQRPSICLSQAGAVSQRLDVLSCNARDNLGIFRTALQLRLKDFKYHRASRGPRALVIISWLTFAMVSLYLPRLLPRLPRAAAQGLFRHP